MGTHMSPCGHMAPIAKRRNITRPYHALARRLTLSESSDQQFHRYDYEFIHHEMIRGSFHDHIYISTYNVLSGINSLIPVLSVY